MSDKVRLVHIEHGCCGDDHSCSVLVAPRDLDIPAAFALRDAWYSAEYVPAFRSGVRIAYLGPEEWLIERHGCRLPTSAEIENIDADERPSIPHPGDEG